LTADNTAGSEPVNEETLLQLPQSSGFILKKASLFLEDAFRKVFPYF